MTYRNTVFLVMITFVVIATHDIGWVIMGGFGRDSYLPGIYPLACVLLAIGLRFAKTKGLWDSPEKAKS